MDKQKQYNGWGNFFPLSFLSVKVSVLRKYFLTFDQEELKQERSLGFHTLSFAS